MIEGTLALQISRETVPDFETAKIEDDIAEAAKGLF